MGTDASASGTPAADLTNPSQSGLPATPATETPNTPTVDQTEEQPEANTEVPTLEGEEEGGDEAAPPHSEPDADGVITYAPTGDSAMDMALEFVGKLGIPLSDPAMQATLEGNWSLIEAKLAGMGDTAKGYEKFLALAKDADARFTETKNTNTTAINSAISGVLGNEAAAILAWAGKTATPAEKASINKMLRADPVQARAAASILLTQYQKASGTVVTPASATSDPSGSLPNAQSQGPMSNAKFALEAGKLHRQFGNAYMNTPEYAALTRRLG